MSSGRTPTQLSPPPRCTPTTGGSPPTLVQPPTNPNNVVFMERRDMPRSDALRDARDRVKTDNQKAQLAIGVQSAAISSLQRQVQQCKQTGGMAVVSGGSGSGSGFGGERGVTCYDSKRVEGRGKWRPRDGKLILYKPKTGSFFYNTGEMREDGSKKDDIYLKEEQRIRYTAYGYRPGGESDKINTWGLLGVSPDSEF